MFMLKYEIQILRQRSQIQSDKDEFSNIFLRIIKKKCKWDLRN